MCCHVDGMAKRASVITFHPHSNVQGENAEETTEEADLLVKRVSCHV